MTEQSRQSDRSTPMPSPVRVSRRAMAAAVVRSGLRRYSRDFVKPVLDHHGDAARRAESLRQAWRAAHQDHNSIHAAWLGHCSVLLRMGRSTILTDPVLSRRIGMRLGPVTFGPPRLAPPPVLADELPPVDLLLLSHAHFDHLDKPTLRALRDERTTVIVPRGVARLVPRGFGRVAELDWDRDTHIGEIRLGAMKPRHWGARTAWDRHRRFNSYMIEHDDRRVLFAGDTAETDRFASAGPVDLAIFGVGGYDPWINAHANPEQVWRMFRSMPGRYLLPVHHSTFRLSDEPAGQPMQRLITAAGTDHTCILPAEPGRVLRIG